VSNLTKFFILFISVFIIDQIIKYIFVNGFNLDGECISLTLVYNSGVAFSMLSSLGIYLKYLQLALIVAIVVTLLKKREFLQTYSTGLALILSGGLSNIFDRFIHEKGVVDYIYWHCGFNFAIFNFADIMINLGAGIIIFQTIFTNKDSKKNSTV
jgi:signal peptidase II